MKLSIRPHRIELTDELRDLIERRVYFALSRFSPRITRASIVVEDINGPRGGVDKRCQIVVKLDCTDELTVETTDADVHAAISLAADRAGRVVQRELERRCASSRRPPRSPEGPADQEGDIVSAD